MDFSKTATLLANSARRALGSVINKVKANKDLGFNSFTTLFDNCVIPILLYGSGVWGQKYYKVCEDVILRACRFYSGVHRLSPISGIQGDFGWLDCKSRWVIESARLFNRFLNMDDDRLNKKMFLYDKSRGTENWNASFKGQMTASEFSLLMDSSTAKERFLKVWSPYTPPILSRSPCYLPIYREGNPLRL